MKARPPETRSELALPELSFLRARVSMRLLEATTLPPYKGAMLRGGFGYAFQRASCPSPCWGAMEGCALDQICPFRFVFATPHPPDVRHFHDLKDVPRPFVIEPQNDRRTSYASGDALEFHLVLIGRGIDYLPYFLFGFEQLGRMGLGRSHARARLERVEALDPWQPIGRVIYSDGRVRDTEQLPLIDAALVAARAATLPSDLRLTLHSLTRIKSGGDYLRVIEPAALVRAICWRLNALATFHGAGPWPVDHRAFAEQAQAIAVEEARVRWEDWERTSTRTPQPRSMTLGGIIGSALLRGVPPDVRTLLLVGSLVHVGKACVFGHGGYTVEPVGE